MNVHQNARMTVHGRLRLFERVRVAGWRVVDAAAAAGVSERTAYTWLARWREGGAAALRDRTSAPARSPSQLTAEAIAAIERLRRLRWSGPRIARALGRPVSTVGTVLRRLGLAAERPRGHAGSDALRAQRGRRAAPHRQQEARQDRRRRPPDHRRSARPPDAWPRLGIPACRGRRCLAPGLHGAPARRARPDLRRFPRPRRRLVRRPRRPDRARHDRQRLRLHQGRRFRATLPSSGPAT